MANYNDKIGNILCKKLYPVIADKLDSNTNKFMKHISNFFNKNHDKIYDIATYDNIYHGQLDIDDMFKSLDISEKEVLAIIKDCYFFNVPGINPQCVKEPYVETLMMAIRYYLKKNDERKAEIVGIYLAFSGKFYASIFSSAYTTAPPSKYKAVMDYVINNMLTDKFDLKREGTVFGAVKSMVITWLNTYKKQLTSESSNDEDFKMCIQQLRDRMKSFIYNIMELYYEAYKSKAYMNYETDNQDPDDFHLADNDAYKASRLTEKVINYMTSNKVSLQVCNMCKDKYVKATEICEIMEAILSKNDNIPVLKKIISIIICDFLRKYPNGDVKSVDFVSYTIKAKPNSKDKYLVELKDSISMLLDDNSIAYRRKSKERKQSYYRAILMYFTLIINKQA